MREKDERRGRESYELDGRRRGGRPTISENRRADAENAERDHGEAEKEKLRRSESPPGGNDSPPNGHFYPLGRAVCY